MRYSELEHQSEEDFIQRHIGPSDSDIAEMLGYLRQQIELLVENHDSPILVGPSETPIPLHFALSDENSANNAEAQSQPFLLRDLFDVPDLATTNDDIVNGDGARSAQEPMPLAPFTAQRVDYSLARLAHYTATDPSHFQNYVLFTNYQF